MTTPLSKEQYKTVLNILSSEDDNGKVVYHWGNGINADYYGLIYVNSNGIAKVLTSSSIIGENLTDELLQETCKKIVDETVKMVGIDVKETVYSAFLLEVKNMIEKARQEILTRA